jgi:hypothetical protein
MSAPARIHFAELVVNADPIRGGSVIWAVDETDDCWGYYQNSMRNRRATRPIRLPPNER